MFYRFKNGLYPLDKTLFFVSMVNGNNYLCVSCGSELRHIPMEEETIYRFLNALCEQIEDGNNIIYEEKILHRIS